MLNSRCREFSHASTIAVYLFRITLFFSQLGFPLIKEPVDRSRDQKSDDGRDTTDLNAPRGGVDLYNQSVEGAPIACNWLEGGLL